MWTQNEPQLRKFSSKKKDVEQDFNPASLKSVCYNQGLVDDKEKLAQFLTSHGLFRKMGQNLVDLLYEMMDQTQNGGKAAAAAASSGDGDGAQMLGSGANGGDAKV